ncbi:MAG: D-alanine--D-alanine ligase [Acidobacteria bacterium]|nr:D-alanine--D-alanine ligase [Acidobacteriota bacterium]
MTISANLRPAVLFGGPSPEHDISILTGLQATRSLSQTVKDVTALYWSKAGEFFSVDPGLEAIAFAEGVPRGATPLIFAAGPEGGFLRKHKPLPIDVVVNCCHGGPGEDGTIQAAFDLAGLAYTGPSLVGAYLGRDKRAFTAVAAAAGLPTLPRVAVTAETEAIPFAPPYVVKPRFGGSSLGIEVVDDAATARALAAGSPLLRDGAVAEPFLEESRDLNVAVRSYPSLLLSAIERPERKGGGGIYSYAQKYLSPGGAGLVSSPRELPAQIPDELAGRIRRMAGTVAALFAVRSVARIDFLERRGEVWVNEVNTIPGSLSVYLWIDPPLGWAGLLAGLIAEARGSRRVFSAAGSDGAALRGAASVAAKLGGAAPPR